MSSVVTRIQIADLVGDAFGPDGATRSGILACAVDKGAHPQVLATLENLPEEQFRTMRRLWEHLADVPVA